MARPITQGENAEQADVDRILRALKRARQNKTRSRRINDELISILKRALVIYNSDEEKKTKTKAA